MDVNQSLFLNGSDLFRFIPQYWLFNLVYSHHLEWNPQGQQQQQMADVRPVFEDILIAKLRPGQTIDVVCYCQKGVGKDHAKYSPVSTAAYR